MHSLLDIAKLEEARLATVAREMADDFLPIAGGIAARGVPGVWINQVFGAGMQGSIEPDELAPLIDWYASKGIEPRVELCPYADPSFTKALAQLNFTPRDFDNVFFRELTPDAHFDPPHPAPAELRIQHVDPREAALVRAYSKAVMPQFIAGVPPREEDYEFSDRAVRHPRTIALAAFFGQDLVGGGAMEIHGEVATLWGLAIVPEYRRRGIQQALIAERLRIARDRGASIATIGSRPGHITERNVRRMGFQVAYTKVILTRPGPGLTGVIG
jgi:GNAT superfamily N-acetyltransferase